jgi:3-oxoacyl-[acyl-carrier protein] reductase
MNGRTALVVAASKGIGKAIAAELCSRGARVMITSRSAENLTKAKSSILAQNKDGEVHCRVMDLDNEEATKAMLVQAVNELGTIDFLVANSTSFGLSSVGELVRQDWDRALTAKWWSLYWLVEAVVPVMRKHNGGVILNVGSIYSKEPQNGYGISNSVRLLASAFLKSLSDDLAPSGIRVNQLLCGYVHTERLGSYFEDLGRRQGKSSDQAIADVTKNIPMKRFAKPEEIARVAAFLLSDDASYITGQSLAVDGGLIRTAL